MPPSIDIEPLLEQVAAGDARSLAGLYDRTSPYVFGLVRRIVADADAAADVTQEVYLQVWRTAGSYDAARGSAWSWLALIARSRAIDRLRSERSYREALDEVEREPELASGSRDDPARDAGAAEERRAILEAMARLPEEQRAAVELAFFGGLSHREIAERTKTPLGTVKTRIRTGLQRLERALAQAGVR